jgi:hypothetical protein
MSLTDDMFDPLSSAPATTAPAPPRAIRKSSGGGNKKGTSAERRANHNAVERARRESLNVRFLELAANLPSTCSVRRPSKALIVNKSLDFVRQALNVETSLLLKVQELLKENQDVIEELNNLRQQRGISPRLSCVDATLPAPLTKSDFKSQSQRAVLAIHRGSSTLDGDFSMDDDNQTSASSFSSTDSPPHQNNLHSDGVTTQLSFQDNEGVAGKMSNSVPGPQYLMNTTASFQQQQLASFPMADSFYVPAFEQHHQLQQEMAAHSSSDFLPTPTTAPTAAMFAQMMNSHSLPTTSMENIPNGLSHQQIGYHHHSPNASSDNAHSVFATMTSNAFFEHMYPTPVSVGTPTSSSYTSA